MNPETPQPAPVIPERDPEAEQLIVQLKMFLLKEGE
jgi:hypothetical protein